MSEETLALDRMAGLPPDYLATEHTVAHFREELLTPTLAPAEAYDAWVSDGPLAGEFRNGRHRLNRHLTRKTRRPGKGPELRLPN